MGHGGYDPIRLLKALVLQAWHILSDPGLEEALKVRLDFMMFTGLEDQVPDETTLCKFRLALQKAGLFSSLLEEVNHQLIIKGLAIKPSAGGVLDATIIQSAARPREELEGMAIDREEETTSVIVDATQHLSVDPDATWLNKGNRGYFGFKGFVVTDSEEGHITRVQTTPAHVSEVRILTV